MDRRLPDFVEAWMTYTQDSEASALYRRWVALSVLASAAQRKIWVEIGPHTFYANMYVVLVGISGARKGEAMMWGMEFLNRLGVPLASEAVTRAALVRELYESASYSIQGGGIPGGAIQADSALTVYSMELAVFLGQQNQQLMMDLCDWYDCRDYWKNRTKTQGSEEIHRIWLNVIGGMTPKSIQASLPAEAVGGGLTSRMILVYSEGPERRVPLFNIAHDTGLRDALMHDLEMVHTLQGQMKFTKEYVEKYTEWYMVGVTPIFDDNRFDGYLNRRAVHLLKASMLFSLSRSNDTVITEADFDQALSLLEATEARMPEVFVGYGKNIHAGTMSEILRCIKLSGSIRYRDLLFRFQHDADVETMRTIVQTLESMGAIVLTAKGRQVWLCTPEAYNTEQDRSSNEGGEKDGQDTTEGP